VTLVNLGPSTAQNVTLTDVLSAGLSRIRSAQAATTARPRSRLVGRHDRRITTSSLALGQTLTLVVNATVSGSASGRGDQHGRGHQHHAGPDAPDQHGDGAHAGGQPAPTCTLTKVASSATACTAGGTISYTVTLVNLGPSTAQNVTITDVLSAGLSRIGQLKQQQQHSAVAAGGRHDQPHHHDQPGAGPDPDHGGQRHGERLSQRAVVTNTAAGTSTTPDPTPDRAR
jgi:uncharacterized repeat protein (TIGR01451 family)